MENSYGIGVRNRYALFLDDEADPLEILKEREQEKEEKKKIKVSEKENKIKLEPSLKPKPAALPKKVIKETHVQKVQDAKREDSKPNNQRPNDGKVERSLNKFNNESREERNNRRNREDRNFNGPAEGTRDREERPRRTNLRGDNFDNRNRGARSANINREGGGPRAGGPRGGRNDNRRGKREFDRQSGSDKTGVKHMEKRDGGGAHNWGSNKDIIEEVDKSNEIDGTWQEVDKNDSAASVTEVKDVGPEPEADPPAPEVEEPKELTLDEWKAIRAGRAKPTYNTRKAGEGEDPAQWKKMYELKKKEDGEGLQESDDEEFDASEYPQRVGRQKHVLAIDIHFSDARRANGGGGGPGAGGGRARGARFGRGGGSAGGGRPRGDRQQRFRGAEDQAATTIHEEASQRSEKAPKVDDERDFPSLG